jgi:hypothetical protein
LKKHVQRPPIDECHLQNTLREITGIPDLVVLPGGKVEIPWQTPVKERLAIVRVLDESQSAANNLFRFEIGRQINALPLAHGEKKGYVKKEFGEQKAFTYLGYAWVEHKWQRKTDFPWPWSFYKESANSTHADQNTYMFLWSKGQLSILHLREMCKQKRAGSKNSHGNFTRTDHFTDSPLTALHINGESIPTFLQYSPDSRSFYLFTESEDPVAMIGPQDYPAIISVGLKEASKTERKQYQQVLHELEEQERDKAA